MKAKQAKRNRKVYFVPEYSRDGKSKDGWVAGIIVKALPKGAIIAYKDHTDKYNFNQLKYTPYRDLVLDSPFIKTIGEESENYPGYSRIPYKGFRYLYISYDRFLAQNQEAMQKGFEEAYKEIKELHKLDKPY